MNKQLDFLDDIGMLPIKIITNEEARFNYGSTKYTHCLTYDSKYRNTYKNVVSMLEISDLDSIEQKLIDLTTQYRDDILNSKGDSGIARIISRFWNELKRITGNSPFVLFSNAESKEFWK